MMECELYVKWLEKDMSLLLVSDVTPKDRGLVLPQGANIRYVDIGPGQTIPMVQ
jgi:hypothetical protein